MSDGISHPPWLRRILRKFTAVGPDRSPRMAPFDKLQHAIRQYHEFNSIVVAEPARPTQWIAFQHAVFRIGDPRTLRSFEIRTRRIEELFPIRRQVGYIVGANSR